MPLVAVRSLLRGYVACWAFLHVCHASGGGMNPQMVYNLLITISSGTITITWHHNEPPSIFLLMVCRILELSLLTVADFSLAG